MRYLIAFIAAAFLLSPAPVLAKLLFGGEATLVSESEDCVLATPEKVWMLYEPGRIGGNTDTWLGVFPDFEVTGYMGAHGYRLKERRFTKVFAPMSETVYLAAQFGPYTTPVRIRIESQKPVIRPTSTGSEVVFDIDGWDSQVGCVTRWKAELWRKSF